MWEMNFDKGEPVLPFALNGVEQAGTLHNLEVYTHEEPYQDVDHLWLINSYERRRVMGNRIWRLVVPSFDELVALLDEHKFKHVHTNVPLEVDLNAFTRYEVDKLDEERP